MSVRQAEQHAGEAVPEKAAIEKALDHSIERQILTRFSETPPAPATLPGCPRRYGSPMADRLHRTQPCSPRTSSSSLC